MKIHTDFQPLTIIMKNSMHLIRPITLFILLFLGSTSCFAGIYKWVDKDGAVHYGQQRPQNTPSKSMDIQHYSPNGISNRKPAKQKENSSNKQAGTNNEKAGGTKEPKKKKETKTEKKRRLAACDQARQNLATMKSIGRIRSRDKDGNTSYLSQKDKEAKMKKTRDLISKHCK